MNYEKHQGSTTFPHLKLCIQPSEIEMKNNNKGTYWIVNFLKRICLFFPKRFRGSKCRVYFYDEQSMLKGGPTGFSISKNLLETTMERMQKKESSRMRK